MPVSFRLICLPVLGLLLALGGTARAHQVPTMQIEAEFKLDQSYSLRINLDPRVFLSEQPSSLPPVPAAWYRDQTPAQIAETEKAAREYLRKNVELQFGVEKVPLPDFTFVAMDGAKNEPITAETEEVHLLASAQSAVTVNGRNFSINLGRDAKVSLILLNTMEGQSERKPRVIFPGESSEPFPLTGMHSKEALKAVENLPPPPKSEARIWMFRGGLAVILFVVYSFFLKKRRRPTLETRQRRRGR